MVRVYRESWPWYVSICYCGPRGARGYFPKHEESYGYEPGKCNGNWGHMGRYMDLCPTFLVQVWFRVPQIDLQMI